MTSSEPDHFAIIDVGSNSIRLEVVKPSGETLERVMRDRVVTRLGSGLSNHGGLDDDAMSQSIQVLNEMISRISSNALLRIVATAAVREASNGPEFVEAVRESTGHVIEVLSSEAEAGYVLRGVQARYSTSNRRVAAIDIGGGSTELILADRGVVTHVASLPLGAVTLAGRYEQTSAMDPDHFAAMQREVEDAVTACLPVPMPEIDEVYASGGTFTTMAAVDLFQSGTTSTEASAIDGHQLSVERINGLLNLLIPLDAPGREAIAGIDARRSDIIVAGASLADTMIRGLRVPSVTVHTPGIRLGLLLEMAES
jgi:exopolyphosphatase/guanosine-5'-triphosphate,3'-diphosphate pyrophosphatase